jgi:hypothetical protein
MRLQHLRSQGDYGCKKITKVQLAELEAELKAEEAEDKDMALNRNM